MARFYTAIPLALTLLMLLAMGLQAYERIRRAQDWPTRPTPLPRTALSPMLGWALFAAVMAFVLISTWQRPCADNCGARFLTFLPLAGGLVILGGIALLARRSR